MPMLNHIFLQAERHRWSPGPTRPGAVMERMSHRARRTHIVLAPVLAKPKAPLKTLPSLAYFTVGSLIMLIFYRATRLIQDWSVGGRAFGLNDP